MIDSAHLIWIIPLSSLAGGFVWLVLFVCAIVHKTGRGVTKNNPKE